MRYSWRLSAGVAGFFASASWIIGCSVAPATHPTNPLQPSTPSAVSFKGIVHGGQWPVKGAQIYLLAASRVTPGPGDSGYGDLSTSLISTSPNSAGLHGWQYVLTNSGGSFDIPDGTWSCNSGDEVYLYSVGGDAIDQNTINSSNLNSAAGMMAVLGPCGAGNSIANLPASIYISEVTTVAAAYSLAGFATDATHISSPATGQGYLGIQNAVKNAALLGSISTGNIAQPPSNVLVPTATIYTVADILADCINSQNSSTTQCTRLMADETYNSTQPTDTASAAINMAHQPGANVADIYNNMLADQVYGGFINTGPPNDFAIGVSYSAGGLTAPTAVAIDAGGNAWVTDTPGGGSSGAVIVLNPQGTALTPTGGNTCGGTLAEPSLISLIPSSSPTETAWVTSLSQGTLIPVQLGSDGGDCQPISAPDFFQCSGRWCYPVITIGNDLLIADNGRSSVDSYDFTGTPGPSWSVFANPLALAIDGASQDIWVVDSGFSGSVNPAIYIIDSGTVDLANGNAPFDADGIGNATAVGLNRSLWVTDLGNNAVYLFSSDFTTGPTPTASLSQTISSTSGGINNPGAITVDGAGTAWIVDGGGANIAAIGSDGTALSPNASLPTTNGGYSGNQALDSAGTPTGVAVDPSGNVWVTQQNAGSPVIEFIGMAAPAVTPLADAVVNNTIAKKP